ncbi:MAG TPA: hypothetical protein VD907_01110 [Verrucomicrobiae bacterium]|nr:hypothetical protein [Verrucomicrobiae bacterium]
MLFKGQSEVERSENRAAWLKWRASCAHKPTVTFANQFVQLLEEGISQHGLNLDIIFVSALRTAGSEDLPRVEVEKVIQHVGAYWYFGNELSAWASGRDLFAPEPAKQLIGTGR